MRSVMAAGHDLRREQGRKSRRFYRRGVGVCGIAFQNSVRFGMGCQKFFGIGSVQNLTNSADWLGIDSESKFVCTICVTKHCEKFVCSRRPALLDFPQLFWQSSVNRLSEFWTFEIRTFLEFQKLFVSARFGFWNSDSDSEPYFGIPQTSNKVFRILKTSEEVTGGGG